MLKKIVRSIIFLIVFVLLFLGVSKVLIFPGDYRIYQWIAGFYQEPKASLDAVYIGSSNCYAFWNPLTAWADYGIAVYPYASSAQHFIAAEYLIREARKTQPDALFIVNTNTIDSDTLTVARFHQLLDYMPFSLNKLRLTRYLCETAALSTEESMELYFPLYRYHDRWSELSPKDFYNPINGLKGANTLDLYLNTSQDLAELYTCAEGRSGLPGYIRDAAMSLMDYCEQENLRILFVTVPQAVTKQRIQELNELNAMFEARGFDTLNMMCMTDEIGLDLTQDFYNNYHTNIHGSVKFTSYLSTYLTEHYDIKDKRGDPAYASWDAGYKKYTPFLKKYTLPVERDPSHRTAELTRPEIMDVMEDEGGRILVWTPSEGADGYVVYRRQINNSWETLGETAELRYNDTSAEATLEYDYTVIPFVGSSSARVFGNFDYQCIPANAQ